MDSYGDTSGRIGRDWLDRHDEELEQELLDDELNLDELFGPEQEDAPGELSRRRYFRELFRLQRELVKLQNWVVHTGHKVVILFEGRDAAGKGGVIKRITQRLNPRVCRVAALPAPNDREQTQWYFQRYVRTCRPAARSSCSTAAGTTAPGSSGSWVSATTNNTRNSSAACLSSKRCWRARASSCSSTGSPSPTPSSTCVSSAVSTIRSSSGSSVRWTWSRGGAGRPTPRPKETMLERTHIPEAPWWVVQADDKKRARLNCIHHLLQQMPYREVPQPPVHLPERLRHADYVRHPTPGEIIVPEVY